VPVWNPFRTSTPLLPRNPSKEHPSSPGAVSDLLSSPPPPSDLMDNDRMSKFDNVGICLQKEAGPSSGAGFSSSVYENSRRKSVPGVPGAIPPGTPSPLAHHSSMSMGGSPESSPHHQSMNLSAPPSAPEASPSAAPPSRPPPKLSTASGPPPPLSRRQTNTSGGG
jgi:hypothetical protein